MSGDITNLLSGLGSGESAEGARLHAVVYAELHRLARVQRRRWDGDHTMNTTALVHEAYLKLAGSSGSQWQNRAHFFAVASKAMRQVLINYAEARRAARRGGGAVHVDLDHADTDLVSDTAADELVALDEALRRLAVRNERQVRVVECRFFAGLSIRETSEALGVSTATVERDWAVASAWLSRELGQ